MSFESIISQIGKSKKETINGISSNWAQGRTLFGGLSTAIIVNNMLAQIDQDKKILSLSVNLIAPLLSSKPFILETELLRSGKNTTQLLSKLSQNNQVCIIAQASFAKSRVSALSFPINRQCSLKKINEKYIIPIIEGVTPSFFQNIDINLQEGGLPFTNSDTSILKGWMRFKGSDMNRLQLPHLIALADAWPSTILQMCNKPAPASTMSWYIEFIQSENFSGPWLGFEGNTQLYRDGYGIEEATIFDSKREPIALTRQTVAIFE